MILLPVALLNLSSSCEIEQKIRKERNLAEVGQNSLPTFDVLDVLGVLDVLDVLDVFDVLGRPGKRVQSNNNGFASNVKALVGPKPSLPGQTQFSRPTSISLDLRRSFTASLDRCRREG